MTDSKVIRAKDLLPESFRDDNDDEESGDDYQSEFENDEDDDDNDGSDDDGNGNDEDDQEDEDESDEDEDDDNTNDNNTNDDEGTVPVSIRSREDIVDDLDYDVFNLLASSYHTVHVTDPTSEEGENNLEIVLRDQTQRAAQLLMKKLMECPRESSEVGPLVVLPNETSVLPRAYKLPEPKPETKWEKFAKEKGIKKTKKERMVWDEVNQEYRPRYGYKRAVSIGVEGSDGKNGGKFRGAMEEVPIMEVATGQDPFADPWEAAREEKKNRVKKNAKNQLRNQGRAAAKLGKTLPAQLGRANASYDPEYVPGIPVDIAQRSGGKQRLQQRGKGGLKQALQLVQQSTASMGRFDEKRPGEPTLRLAGKKRAFRDNVGSSSSEKASMSQQLRFVADKVDKKARGVTNSLASYDGILPDAPTDTFKQKKGKGKARSSVSAGAKGKKGRK